MSDTLAESLSPQPSNGTAKMAVTITDDGSEHKDMTLVQSREVVDFMLDAFTFELPDPDQELFFQYPNTFSQFPQLVLELRLMIWKEASPRSWHFMKEAACGTLCHNYKCNAVTPITSRICQESRCETLIRYQNLTSTRSTGPPSCMSCQAWRKDRTFFWHGGRDVLILPSTWQNLDNFKNLLSSHYTQDELSFKNFCASIRTLAPSPWRGCPLAREDIASVRETFPGLQNLKLIDTTQGRDDPSCRLIGKNAQDSLNTFAQTFKRLKGENPEISVPSIVITRNGKPVFGPGF